MYCVNQETIETCNNYVDLIWILHGIDVSSCCLTIVGTDGLQYCERRYFRAVHIFALFAFIKYPRKYEYRKKLLVQ